MTLKEGIDAFYNTKCFDLLGQPMSEESLMQPIQLISAFLEGIKSVGRISDYDVRFQSKPIFNPTSISRILNIDDGGEPLVVAKHRARALGFLRRPCT